MVAREHDTTSRVRAAARHAYAWPLNYSWARFLGAAGATLVALSLRILLLNLTGQGAPYLLFFGAVLVSSYAFGRGPGILAAVLAGLAGPLLVSNYKVFSLLQVAAQVVLFWVEGALMAYVTHAFASSKRVSEQQNNLLEASEERWELVAKATSDTIRDWHVLEDTIVWSAALRHVFGYDGRNKSPLLSFADWCETIHPEDRTRVRRNVQEHLARGERAWKDAYRFRHAKGSYLIVSERCYVVYDNHNRPVRLIAAMRDITRQSEAVRARENSEAQLKLVCDTLPALVALTDRQLRFRFVNATYEQWFGLEPREMIGKTSEEIFAHKHSPQRQRAVAEVLKGKISTFEEVLPRRDVGPVLTEHTYVPNVNSRGEFLGMVILVQDVSAKRKQEEELRQSEEHYRVLTEVSPQVTWEATREGQLTYVNTWWQRYTGLDSAQSLGFGWLRAVPESGREKLLKTAREAFDSGNQLELEVTFNRGIDGAPRVHLVRGQPLLDGEGKIVKWVGVATDIHEQKATEAQLATAVAARDNFLSMASHELKTPLTSMQLMTQMMRRSHEKGRADAFEPGRVKRLIAQTDKSVQRLTRIIDDMLDVSRIARGKMAFRFESFDLRDLVTDVIERMREQLHAGGVEVKMQCESPLKGDWDRFRIEQVLTNLLTNALRYGGGSPIEVRALPAADDRVQLVVKDHGPGIAEDDKVRVFEQFERASTKSALGGLGLGLYICRQIVERHGGRIDLSSDVGAGAKFTVELPRHPAPMMLQNNLEEMLAEGLN